MGVVINVRTKNYELQKLRVRLIYNKLMSMIRLLALEKGWLLNIVALLMGRATILTGLSPFAVAFLAAIWLMDRRRAFSVILFIIIGALTESVDHATFIFLAMLVFTMTAYLFRELVSKRLMVSLFVFLALLGPRLFFDSLAVKVTAYHWLLGSVEGLLGVMLVLIFMQSVPLLLPNRYKTELKNEEIVCLVILLATVLTGMIGWVIFGAAVEHIFSRYLVLVLAFVGGAAIGSTVGVVAGLILSLAYVSDVYQMSLLAFGGLLGGLLKGGKKLGVRLGMFIGTGLVSIYSSPDTLLPALLETSLAISLFLLTPKAWFNKLSHYIPGTVEHARNQEQYLQKVRQVTAKRVEQFSDVFAALSQSFEGTNHSSNEQSWQQKETDYFLSYVTEDTCQKCFLKDHCWRKQFQQTYSLMEEMKYHLGAAEGIPNHLMNQFRNHCVKSRKVVDTMTEYMSFFTMNQQLKKQIVESKRLVANQLRGVSEVMDNFAREILKERHHHEKQEQLIVQAIKELGLELEKLEIYQLDKGNIDIEMTLSFFSYHGEGSKLIAPLLSQILNETIVVTKEEASPFPNGYCYLAFGSAKQFVIQTDRKS